MTTSRRPFVVLAATLCALFAHAAGATPVLWTLTDVEFDDAGTASGSFIYDADTGAFSAVAVSTSGGSLPPVDYADVLFGGEFDALMVIDPFADLTGVPTLQLIFQAPLTNAGGFVDLASFDPFFSSFEQTCGDPLCFSAVVERTVISGGLIGTVVPLPAGFVLLLSALGILPWARRR